MHLDDLSRLHISGCTDSGCRPDFYQDDVVIQNHSSVLEYLFHVADEIVICACLSVSDVSHADYGETVLFETANRRRECVPNNIDKLLVGSLIRGVVREV